jgi:hypothetical protein
MEASRIPQVSGCEVQRGAEPFEVLLQVLQVRIAVVDGAIGQELGLNQGLEPEAYPRDDYLGGFGVKVAAEPLEMRAEQYDVTPQVLFAQARVGRSERLGCRQLSVDFGQARQALVLPVLQSDGRHHRPSDFESAPEGLMISNASRIHRRLGFS